jgi:hypothetical protein
VDNNDKGALAFVWKQERKYPVTGLRTLPAGNPLYVVFTGKDLRVSLIYAINKIGLFCPPQ